MNSLAEHIEGVTTSLNRLKELLDLIKSEQLYYKSRERRHRKSASTVHNAHALGCTHGNITCVC